MGNALCCVPCGKPKKSARTTATREIGTNTPVDTRITKNDGEIVAVTGAMTGFDRVVRRSHTIRIFVDCFAYPELVEPSVLPDLSTGQLEGYRWSMILLYTTDLSGTFVIAGLRAFDSLRTVTGSRATTIQDCPDRAVATIRELPDLASVTIQGSPDLAAPVAMSGDEERAQLEKAAHLKAKRRANFKKLKAKIKAKKLAKKMASGDADSPTN